MRTARLPALLAALLPALAGAAPLRLTLAPEPPAEVRFRVDAPLDFIPGHSGAVAGWVELDPASLAGCRARVEVDLASFDTGIGLRNEDLRDQLFEADRYKVAVLQVRGLEAPGAPSLQPGRSLRAEALGTLSLHGVEREVRIPITLRLEAGARPVLAVTGAFRVALRDHAIPRPSRLFLKLGEAATVSFRATFAVPPPAEVPAAQVVAAAAQPALSRPAVAPPAPAAPPRRPAPFLPLGRAAPAGPKPRPAFHFDFDTPAGRGERLFRDPTIGGPGNAVACAHCHTTADERWGLVLDGQVRPDRTLYGSATRPLLWQGMARGVGKAASICAKWFMLRSEGLEPAREADLTAFLARMSPDPAPALDYRALAFTRQSDLPDPLGGDARRGKVLEHKFCGGCHAEKGIRSPLTPGLYEAGDLVRRVRWLPGSEARQMPPIYADRLPDSDLRDIVTYLVGDPSQRIFQRRGR